MRLQVITIGLLFVTVGHTTAQESRPTMTVEEAFRIAHERNPAFRRAQLDIRDAEAGVLTAFGSFLPTLSANMGWNGSRNTTTTGEDFFGGTVVESQSRTITNSSASQGISTSLLLFDGFRNVNSMRSARRGVEAAEAAVAIEELALQANVGRAFYQAVVAGRLIDVEEQQLQSAQEALERQERLFRIASSTQVDVLTAQLAVAQREETLERAINEATKRRLEVLQILGTLGEVTDFEPIGELPAVFDPEALSIDALLAVASAVHPSVAQTAAAVAQSESQLAQAKAERLPSITVNGNYGRNARSNGYSSFFDLNPNLSRGFGFGLNVSLPIFSGFTISESTSRARAVVRRAEESAWETRLQLEQQVRSALIDLQSAHTAFQIQTRSRAFNRRRVQLAQEQYRFGAMTFIELQRLIDDMATAERNLLNRQLDFATTLVTLEQQVGQSISRPEPQ